MTETPRPYRPVFLLGARAWAKTHVFAFSSPFKPHRLNGPAIEWDDGSKAWYHHGAFVRSEYVNQGRPSLGIFTDSQIGVTQEQP